MKPKSWSFSDVSHWYEKCDCEPLGGKDWTQMQEEDVTEDEMKRY